MLNYENQIPEFLRHCQPLVDILFNLSLNILANYLQGLLHNLNGVTVMRSAANVVNVSFNQQYQPSTLLSTEEIDTLLAKLARGHIGTMQEEYAELKKVLCCL